eukprot:5267456-Amphidinium_carterae.1
MRQSIYRKQQSTSHPAVMSSIPHGTLVIDKKAQQRKVSLPQFDWSATQLAPASCQLTRRLRVLPDSSLHECRASNGEWALFTKWI